MHVTRTCCSILSHVTQNSTHNPSKQALAKEKEKMEEFKVRVAMTSDNSLLPSIANTPEAGDGQQQASDGCDIWQSGVHT